MNPHNALGLTCSANSKNWFISLSERPLCLAFTSCHSVCVSSKKENDQRRLCEREHIVYVGPPQLTTCEGSSQLVLFFFKWVETIQFLPQNNIRFWLPVLLVHSVEGKTQSVWKKRSLRCCDMIGPRSVHCLFWRTDRTCSFQKLLFNAFQQTFVAVY